MSMIKIQIVHTCYSLGQQNNQLPLLVDEGCAHIYSSLSRLSRQHSRMCPTSVGQERPRRFFGIGGLPPPPRAAGVFVEEERGHCKSRRSIKVLFPLRVRDARCPGGGSPQAPSLSQHATRITLPSNHCGTRSTFCLSLTVLVHIARADFRFRLGFWEAIH